MIRKNKKKKVAIGLSGGVDSSVAAFLLKQEGYEVTGVFMKCWDEKADGCTAEEDRASAVSVAARLKMKIKTLDYTKEYKERVIKYFYDEYRAGRTPNPDIMCNKEIKFGMFLDWALKHNFDYVATGHYARVEHGEEAKLLAGLDEGKDQSYFLYRLDQEQLTRSLFPLGVLNKADVRQIAKEQELSTYDKPDSQGICFIGKVDIKEFLKREIDPKPGKVFHVNGEEVGTHDGVWFYTIGQRHGFKVEKYFGLPLYVVGKRIDKNDLIVGFTQDVLDNEFTVGDLHWISGSPPVDFNNNETLKCKVRIRHLGKLHDCTVSKYLNGLKVQMTTESFGIAPGQSAVFYLKEEVLGGGIIQ